MATNKLKQWNYQREINYRVAIRYYEQKQRMFFNFYEKKYGTKINEEFSKMMEDIGPVWTDFCNKAIMLSNDKNSYKQVLNNFVKVHNIPYVVTDGSVKGQLGNIYEHWLNKEISQYLNTIINKGVNNIVSGAIQSKSATTKRKSSIRNDLLMFDGLTNINYGKNIDVAFAENLKTKMIQNLELQNEFLLEDEKFLTAEQELSQDFYDIFFNYLNPNGMTDLGGFNLKYWSGDGHGKRFSDSAKLAQKLNIWYEQANYGKGTMTNEYAYSLNFFYISQRLLNIISPTTVGFFSGNSFTLTSEILKKYYFYFALNNKYKEKDIKEWQHWRVDSSNVINFYNKNRQQANLYKKITIYKKKDEKKLKTTAKYY